jgi:hypothetical protein
MDKYFSSTAYLTEQKPLSESARLALAVYLSPSIFNVEKLNYKIYIFFTTSGNTFYNLEEFSTS